MDNMVDESSGVDDFSPGTMISVDTINESSNERARSTKRELWPSTQKSSSSTRSNTIFFNSSTKELIDSDDDSYDQYLQSVFSDLSISGQKTTTNIKNKFVTPQQKEVKIDNIITARSCHPPFSHHVDTPNKKFNMNDSYYFENQVNKETECTTPPSQQTLADAYHPFSAPSTRSCNLAETRKIKGNQNYSIKNKEQIQFLTLPTIKVPPQIKTPLLPHQKIGLNWLVYQESEASQNTLHKEVEGGGWKSIVTNDIETEPCSPILGGILADEMGLGKSLQVLALLLAHPFEDHESTPLKKLRSWHKQQGASEHTVPKEVINHIKKDHVATLRRYYKLFVEKYHENCIADEDTMSRSELIKIVIKCLKYNVASLERYFQFAHTPEKVRKKAYITEKKKSHIKTTLIVCPVSVFSTWESEIKNHLKPGTLIVHRYHGQSRKQLMPILLSNDVDVLITSYATLGAEFRSCNSAITNRKREHEASLFYPHFHRIVLDEAHKIRNINTDYFRSVRKLKATYRLCVTGTPVPNQPQDLFALFSFLKLYPIGSDPSIFEKLIVTPFVSEKDAIGIDRLRILARSVTCRRTKDEVGIKLTAKNITVQYVDFPPRSIHQRIYNALYLTLQSYFKACLKKSRESTEKYHAHALEALTRIRQACLSGALIPRDQWEMLEREMTNYLPKKEDGTTLVEVTVKDGTEVVERLWKMFEENQNDGDDAGDEYVCNFCLQGIDKDNIVVLRGCKHIFCDDCINVALSTQSHIENRGCRCPRCLKPFVKKDVRNTVKTPGTEKVKKERTTNKKNTKELKRSPKVLALLRAIGEMRPDEKGVIFSHFTSFLDVVHEVMIDNDITSITRIDGRTTLQDRLKNTRSFNDEEGGTRFILCSVMAAGTGIDLTRGNHCFVMDLWWNQAVEDQAVDRVHRVGQTRNVRIVKFVMRDSVEEKILRLQEAKAIMSKAVVKPMVKDEEKGKMFDILKRLFDIEE